MQSIIVVSDIAKFADLQWKNADVSRSQGVCCVIHIFYGSSLGKVNFCQVSALKNTCDRF